MYDHTTNRDYVRTEMEYRLGRIREDIVGRRKRRSIRERLGDLGDVSHTTDR